MNETKIVQFTEQTDQHARLITRLRYDRITQGNFFRGLVELYINKDLDIIKAVEKIKTEKSTMGKRKRESSIKEIRQGKQKLEDLGLTKSEKNFIYDLIEEDFEE